MPTLRTLAMVTTGLYRDTRTGRAYRREELLAHVPASLLDRPLRLTKEAAGIYRLSLEDGQEIFEILSRRRHSRPEHPR